MDRVLERAPAMKIDETLLEPGDRVLVGLSGGPDSSALLAILSARPDLWIAAAHLDHCMHDRGAEALAACRRLCARLGVPLYCGRVDVAGRARAARRSLEDVARQERYAFLARIAAGARAVKVAVGHHASDQAETLLLNAVRGAGVRGLAAMARRRPLAPGVELVRPFLAVSRSEILAWLAGRTLEPFADPTNDDLSRPRNHVRSTVLRSLETLNPKVVATLGRLAARAREAADIIDDLAGEALEGMILADVSDRPGPGEPAALCAPLLLSSSYLTVRRSGLERLEARLLEPVLRAALRRGSREGPLRLLPDGIERTRGVLRARLSGLVDLGPLQLLFAGEVVHALLAPRRTPRPEPYEVPLVLGTSQLAPGLGIVVETFDHDGAPVVLPDLVDERVLAGGRLRSRRPGDRVRPLGAPGERKLAEVLIDRKVPRVLRDRIPVLEGADGIAWVYGSGTCEPYRVRPATRRILHLRVAARALVALLVFLGFGGAARAGESVRWAKGLPEALAEAKRTRRLVFAEVYGVTCHACVLFKRQTLSRPDVARLLNRKFVNLRIERAERRDLVRTYRVRGTPEILFLDGDGHLIARMTGFRTPARLKTDVDQVLSRYRMFRELEREATRRNPGNPLLHLQLGKMLADSDGLDKAAIHLRRAAVLDPENRAGVKVVALYHLGRVEIGRRASARALQRFREARLADPADRGGMAGRIDYEVLQLRCRPLLSKGRFREALMRLDEYARVHPREALTPGVLLSAGIACYRGGDAGGALARWRRLARQFPRTEAGRQAARLIHTLSKLPTKPNRRSE